MRPVRIGFGLHPPGQVNHGQGIGRMIDVEQHVITVHTATDCDRWQTVQRGSVDDLTPQFRLKSAAVLDGLPRGQPVDVLRY